jgi:hypothetical protein
MTNIIALSSKLRPFGFKMEKELYSQFLIRSVNEILDYWQAQGKIIGNYRDLRRLIFAERDKSSITSSILENLDPLVFRLEDLVKTLQVEEDPHLLGQVPTSSEIRIGGDYQGFVEKHGTGYIVCLGSDRIGVVTDDPSCNQVSALRILKRKDLNNYVVRALPSEIRIIRGTRRVINNVSKKGLDRRRNIID